MLKLPPCSCHDARLHFVLSDYDACLLERWVQWNLEAAETACQQLAQAIHQELMMSPSWVAWNWLQFCEAKEALVEVSPQPVVDSFDQWEQLNDWSFQFSAALILKSASVVHSPAEVNSLKPVAQDGGPTPVQLGNGAQAYRARLAVDSVSGRNAGSKRSDKTSWLRIAVYLQAAWPWVSIESETATRSSSESNDWRAGNWLANLLPECSAETLAELEQEIEQGRDGEHDPAARHWIKLQQLPLSHLAAGFWNRMQMLAEREQFSQRFAEELQIAKLASMKELAYGASHEINNPLANISTRAQTLLRDEKDPERRHKLAMIDSQAMRAHEMISNMMLYAHPPELQIESTDVATLIASVIESMSEWADRQSTTLLAANRMEVSQLPADSEAQRDRRHDESVEIQADATHLQVLLQALVRNGLEAVGQGGSVSIDWGFRVEGPNAIGAPGVWIRVSDSGPGIPSKVLPHIFDPFFSGREAGRGLGFGLAKAWRIVEMHRGSIQVVENGPTGAVFEVWLPLRCEAHGDE